MKQVLIIALIWPEPKSSAAGWHMMQLLSFFHKSSYRIHFACTADSNEKSVDLELMGIVKHSIKVNDASFDELLNEISPEIVVFDRFMAEEQFGWRVMETLPNALRILNTEDLHGLRKGREMAFQKSEDFGDSHLMNEVMKRELAAIWRCDLSLIISKYEIDLLTTKLSTDHNNLIYYPFLLNTESEKFSKKGKPFEQRKNFVCIGSFKHAPNKDAVTQLKTRIWPKIREEIEDAELHIYGSYMPSPYKKLSDPSIGLYFEGYTESSAEILQNARVLLAPLYFGAGLKGKIMEAMINETPFVTSEIGIEGYNIDYSDKVVGRSDVDFIKMAVMLYTNEKAWNEVALKGKEFVEAEFEREKIETQFSAALDRFKNELHTIRTNNAVQEVLSQETLMSKRYLSKYLELKNRSK